MTKGPSILTVNDVKVSEDGYLSCCVTIKAKEAI